MKLRDMPHHLIKVGMVVECGGDKGILTKFTIGTDASNHGSIEIRYPDGGRESFLWWPYLASPHILTRYQREMYSIDGTGIIQNIEVLD